MKNGRSAWNNPSIDSDVDAGYVMRMNFWPPRFRGDVHKHNRWSVTGVLFNTLDIVIYDVESSGALRESKRYSGIRGQVGKVIPPCIHAAENNSDGLSITLAVFWRPLRKERTGPEVEWVTETQEKVYTRGVYERAIKSFLLIIAENPTERSLKLLDYIYEIASPPLKVLTAKTIFKIDPERALRRLDDAKYYFSKTSDRTELDKIEMALCYALGDRK
jgi:hypothetical protein